MSIYPHTPYSSLLTSPIFKSSYLTPCHSILFMNHILHYKSHILSTLGGDPRVLFRETGEWDCQLEEWIFWKWCIGLMKSMDLTVGDALYLYTICLILPDSRDFLPYKESFVLVALYRTAQTCMAPSSNPTVSTVELKWNIIWALISIYRLRGF
jgi:hypothetical protein